MPTRVDTGLDRAWNLATTHTVVWPSGPLDPDRLAAACATVAGAAGPSSYVGGRIAELAGRAGLPVAGYLERHAGRFVSTAVPASRDAFLADVSGRPRPELPFAFVVGAGGFALSHSHRLGDGSVSARLLEGVLRVYRDGAAPVAVPGRVAGVADLTRALARLWVRNPGLLPRTVAGVVRRYRRRPAPVPARHRPPDGLRVGTVTVTGDQVAAIDRWRRDCPSPPSVSMVLLWLVARALDANGHPPGPQPWQVMVGMRGVCPELSGFAGNLVGRALVDVDPSTGPGSACAGVRQQAGSGEVVALHLAKLAAGTAAGPLAGIRAGLRASSRGSGSSRASRPDAAAPESGQRIGRSPGLSWSDRGRHAFGSDFAALVPPSSGAGPVVFTMVTPVQDGIGVNVNWVGDRAGLVLTFGASPLTGDAIDGVLRALDGGVVALLNGLPEST